VTLWIDFLDDHFAARPLTPPRVKTTRLAVLAQASIDASAALAAAYNAGLSITEAALVLAEDADHNARMALLAYLADTHGIDRMMASKMADVLI
jgi:F0F1-type ATP synthase membrane subunit c/vacuolar-type H+-ATPase subunit K